MTFPVARRYRLQQVIATVDAVHGLKTLERHVEALKQAAVADDLIVTKLDVAEDDSNALYAKLRALNPGARLHGSALDRIPLPSELMVTDIYDPRTKSEDVLAWLNAEGYEQALVEPASHEADDHERHHHHHHDVNRHSAEIGAFCLTFEKPLHWEHLANWLDALVIGHGDDLLRVKGIVNVVGRNKPIVVQAVQRLFHPPFELAQWPGDDRLSRIVFITRGLSQEYVATVYNTISQRKIATSEPEATASEFPSGGQ